MAEKAKPDSPLASLLPDEMIAGGLADDFDGIVREARYAPFDYMGNIEDPVLAVRLQMEPLDLDKGAAEEEVGARLVRVWGQATGGKDARKCVVRGYAPPWLSALGGVVADGKETAA